MDRTVTTRIDEELCAGCGLCVEVCPSDTITMKGKKAAVTGTESLNCGHCAAVCPAGAVQVAGLNPALSTFKTFQSRESWLPHGQGNIQDLVQIMQSRRSCRNFHTEKPVPTDLLEDLVKIWHGLWVLILPGVMVVSSIDGELRTGVYSFPVQMALPAERVRG